MKSQRESLSCVRIPDAKFRRLVVRFLRSERGFHSISSELKEKRVCLEASIACVYVFLLENAAARNKRNDIYPRDFEVTFPRQTMFTKDHVVSVED